MSSFAALNVYEEDRLQDEEEHTRELQIEECYKTFQDALKFQRHREIGEAHKQYDKLFSFEVMKLNFETGLPPAADKLKYLAFKNHSLLLLMELENEIAVTDEEDLVQRLDDIFNEMSEALIYDNEDVSFLYLLFSLAMPLKYYKIARQALECIIFSDSRVSSIGESLLNNELVNPRDFLSLVSLRKLLDKISDNHTIDLNPVLQKITGLRLNPAYSLREPDYSWIVNAIDVSDTPQKLIAREEDRHLDITITTKDWSAIALSLQEACSSLVKSKRKLLFEDPYSYSEHPVNVVKFIMPHGEAVILQDPSSETKTPTPPEEEEPKNKISHRLEEEEEEEEDIELKDAPPSDTGDTATTTETNSTAKVAEIANGDETTKKDETTETNDNTNDIATDTNNNEESTKKRKRKSEFGGRDEKNKSRSSKRVRAREGEQTLEAVDVSSDEDFFEQLNSFLALANTSFPSVLQAFVQDDYDPSDQHIADFKELLQTWDDAQAEVFLIGEAVPTIQGINKPVMQLLDFAALGSSESLRPPFQPSIREIEKFITNINTGNYHIQQVRVELIYSLLCSSSTNRLPSILKDYWPSNLAESIRKMIEACEPLLYNSVKDGLFFSNKKVELANHVKRLEVSQAIFEVFLDYYLTLDKNSRNSIESNNTNSSVNGHGGNKRTSTATLKDLEISRNAAKLRIARWRSLIGDLLTMPSESNPEMKAVELRYKWVGILSSQIDSDDPNESLRPFESFSEWLEKEDPEFEIGFANFANIPKLSLESVNTQISKFKAASVFAQVFEIHSVDEDEGQYFDRIKILESILMPDEQESLVPEHDAIAQFLSTASLEFRVQLWYLLLDAYNSNGESQKSFDGYLRILISSIEELAGESYKKNDEHQRSVVLLRSLNMCLEISRSLVKLVVNGEEELSDSLLAGLSQQRVKYALESIIKLLRVLHIYILLDDAIINNIIQAPSHPTWEKASRQIKELIVRAWTLFYLFFRFSLPEENRTAATLNDTLSIVHEEIGTRGYCGMADGSFLELSIRELIRLSWNESEADMLQCLHCRYGLSLGNEDFQPFDHHSTPEDLDKPSAMRLSSFIMGMILRKKNLNQSILRVDVKSVLDQLYEAIGNPNKNIPAVNHNSNVVEDFLSSPVVSLKFLNDALRGKLTLSFVPSTADIMKVGQGGLYYLLAQAQFTLFKIRKRQQPGRTEDLEEALDYYKYDLACNTNRFESWLGLAHVYDLLAEDDLTWNADNINSKENRKTPSEHQRKSILCAGVAISIYLQSSEFSRVSDKSSAPHFQQLSDGIWTFLARILYNASMLPMKMEAFTSSREKILCGTEGIYTRNLKSDVSMEKILLIVHTCLKAAIANNPKDWYNYYLRAKVLKKLQIRPKLVMKCLKTSVELCPRKDGSHSEPILEPHYKLISNAYKYVAANVITPEYAMEMIQTTPYCEQTQNTNNSSKPEHQFYALCVTALGKIKNSDKKRWQHRPCFRLAKIYEAVYSDKQRAKDEMSPFFQVRTTNKTALHIWKPELERPGQHFEFAYQYVIYYVQLLGRTKDTNALTTLTRKLRKFSSGMSKHLEAWEYTCLVTIKAIREALAIPDKFSDHYIPVLNYEVFDTTSQEIQKELEGQGELPSIVGALNYAAELRRLNNGLGSTAAIDDLFVTVYLKMYQEYIKAQNKKMTTKGTNNATSGGASTPTKISIMDLITPSSNSTPNPETQSSIENNPTPENGNNEPPASPKKSQQTAAEPTQPPSNNSPSKTGQQKTRVNRKDVINRAMAFLKGLQTTIDTTKLNLSPSVTQVSTVSTASPDNNITYNPSEVNSPSVANTNAEPAGEVSTEINDNNNNNNNNNIY